MHTTDANIAQRVVNNAQHINMLLSYPIYSASRDSDPTRPRSLCNTTRDMRAHLYTSLHIFPFQAIRMLRGVYRVVHVLLLYVATPFPPHGATRVLSITTQHALCSNPENTYSMFFFCECAVHCMHCARTLYENRLCGSPAESGRRRNRKGFTASKPLRVTWIRTKCGIRDALSVRRMDGLWFDWCVLADMPPHKKGEASVCVHFL